MQRVINFSGGKTSAYMTILIYQPGDIVLFSDTMREHPKTYKFINDFENYIGFRYDEPNRKRKDYSKKVFNKFPLFDLKITKEQINDFWSKKNYNLEIPHILGNCTLCFNKGQNAIIAILRNFPELADEWIDDEDKANGRTYFNKITIRKLKEIAQNNLFKDYPIENIEPAFNCKCTNF